MTLATLNQLTPTELYSILQQCCGAHAWVEKMCADFPMPDKATLLTTAQRHWDNCSPADGLEAFSHHPRIGDRPTLHQEQAGVVDASSAVLQALVLGNNLYEKHFGYIFIVSASGRSAEEMLSLLNDRLNNPPDEEIKIAMAEQGKITQLRLEKLLS